MSSGLCLGAFRLPGSYVLSSFLIWVHPEGSGQIRVKCCLWLWRYHGEVQRDFQQEAETAGMGLRPGSAEGWRRNDRKVMFQG